METDIIWKLERHKVLNFMAPVLRRILRLTEIFGLLIRKPILLIILFVFGTKKVSANMAY